MNNVFKKNFYFYNLDDTNNIIINVDTFDIFNVTKDIVELVMFYLDNDMTETTLKYNKTSEEIEKILNEIGLYNYSKNKTGNNSIKSIKINVSHSCNMRCKYCYAVRGTYGDPNLLMDKKVARLILDIFLKSDSELSDITFFEGEPLLNYSLIEYLSEEMYNINKKISIGMISNFYYIPQNLDDFIKKYNIRITVSIDGPPEIHDKIRIDSNMQGTYKKISNNVKKIYHATGQPQAFEVTYTDEHKHAGLSKKDIIEHLANEFEINRIIIVDELNSKNKKNENEILDEVSMFFDFLMREKKPVFIFSDVSLPLIVLLSKKPFSYFCGAGINEICITPKGDIYPCQLFIGKSDFCIGNLFEEGNILNLKLNNFRNFISQYTFKNNYNKCYTCISKWWCRQCIGSEYIKFNRLVNFEEDFCNIQNKITLSVLEKLSGILLDSELYRRFYENIKSFQFDEYNY